MTQARGGSLPATAPAVAGTRFDSGHVTLGAVALAAALTADTLAAAAAFAAAALAAAIAELAIVNCYPIWPWGLTLSKYCT